MPAKQVRKVILASKETILEEVYHAFAGLETIQNNKNGNQNAEMEFILDSVLYKLPEMKGKTGTNRKESQR